MTHPGFCYGDLVGTPSGPMRYLWRIGDKMAFVPDVQQGVIIDPSSPAIEIFKKHGAFREYVVGTKLYLIGSLDYRGNLDFNQSPERMSNEQRTHEWEYRLNLVRNGIPSEQKRNEAAWMRRILEASRQPQT